MAVCEIVTFLLVSAVVVEPFQLTIVHTNDVHARFEEASGSGGKCKEDAKKEGRCYGGVARRYTKINELNATHPNMILIDAGDQYQGTLWFNVFKGHAASYFMNLLGYQAMAIGNHEFDLGISGLKNILRDANFPILSANINSSQEPSITGKFVPSTVLNVNGEKIGIIGYTTPDSAFISNPGKLIFRDEVTSVQPIIDDMQTDGINKIILLGHSGYSRDKEIAKKLRGVDVVVGGHSHSFLYTGNPPTDDEIVGPYPTVETNLDGDKVLIIQDFFFGKYLGYLNVNFTPEGKVSSWQGEPILLNSSVPENPRIVQELARWKLNVTAQGQKTVGFSRVGLEGRRTVCRVEECNLGNFITDCMMRKIYELESPNNTWTTAAIALTNSGGIRTDIEQGDITTEDILILMPFQNNIDVFFVKGSALLKAFEHAVAQYDRTSPNGAFLQVSGVQLIYDLRKPSGQRVVSAEVLCNKCVFPKYEPIKKDDVYPVVMPTFTAGGGDGFDFELGDNDNKRLEFLDSDVFQKCVERNSPVFASTEGRIRFCGVDNTIRCPGDEPIKSSAKQALPYWTVAPTVIIAVFRYYTL